MTSSTVRSACSYDSFCLQKLRKLKHITNKSYHIHVNDETILNTHKVQTKGKSFDPNKISQEAVAA